MTIQIPDLDPRNEDEVTADAIAALPAEITDRNRSAPEVGMLEAAGTFYAHLLALINSIPSSLELALLNLLGAELTPATKATVTLDVTSTAAGVTVPAGYVVKTGSGTDAVKFVTDSEVVIAPSSTDQVQATAVVAGSGGNVDSDTLTKTDTPLAGLDSVTNPDAASGGTDTETIASLKARSTLEQRALTKAVSDADFELHARKIGGVERVKALGSPGVEVIHIVVDDLNERYVNDNLNATDGAIRDAVVADAETRAHAGIVIVASQPTPRLVVIDEIEVELEAGASASAVADRIVAASAEYLHPFDVYATDGLTLVRPGWGFGVSLFDRELAVLLDGLEGVKRIGAIKIQSSDDLGATWTTANEFTELEAAAGGLTVPYGLLAWGADYYAGYALTLTEL